MHDGKHRCYIDNTKKDWFVFSFFEGSKRNITRFYTYRGIDKRKGNSRIPRYITEISEESFGNIRFPILQNITMYL